MKEINVLYQCSNEYAPLALVSMVSLFENNKKVNTIVVFLLVNEKEFKYKNEFRSICESYSNIINFIDITSIDRFLSDSNVPLHNGSYATYYKWVAVSSLNTEMEKLLYIDADTIVAGSVTELFEKDYGDFPICMAYDIRYEHYGTVFPELSDGGYYNAGVVLFNISEWKAKDCEKRFLDYIKKGKICYPCYDQDIANFVFSRQIYKLGLEYNFTTTILLYYGKRKREDDIRKAYGISDRFYSNEEIIHAMSNPVIYHCFPAFTLHPWDLGNHHVLSDLWLYYLKISKCENFTFREKKKPLVLVAQDIMFRVLPFSLFSWIMRTLLFLDLKKKRQGKNE